MEPRKRIVYVLKTASAPTRYYTGLTSDVGRRLGADNAGRVPHTARYKPWMIDVVVQFSDGSRAVAFEKYLKSGSGCAFAHNDTSGEWFARFWFRRLAPRSACGPTALPVVEAVR